MEPEAPAKNYQIRELTTAVDNLVTNVASLSEKIDSRLVTKEQLLTTIDVVNLNMRAGEAETARVNAKFDKLNAKISKAIWIVLGVIIPAVVISLLQLTANIFPGAGK